MSSAHESILKIITFQGHINYSCEEVTEHPPEWLKLLVGEDERQLELSGIEYRSQNDMPVCLHIYIYIICV